MLGISARFLLGTYTGHRADGTVDPFPDPARLHAALTNAACQGSTAVLDGERLRPSTEALSALRWLEANPPTGLHLPEAVPVTKRPVVAYRKEGVLRKEGTVWKDKVTIRGFSDGYAVRGPVGWRWDQEVPATVRVTIDALCADVSCLGEATSPVVLELVDVEPNVTLDPDASLFTPGGHTVRIAETGRVDALLETHRSANGKAPTASQDRHNTSELPAPPSVAIDGLANARYFPTEQENLDMPWGEVILLPTDVDVPHRDRVAWCTALHRALVSRIGLGAPPLVTGVYESGVPRPANRLAIQYLHRSLLDHLGLDSHAFALLVPSDADPEECAVLARALAGMTTLRSRLGVAVLDSHARFVAGSQFWPPAPEERTRLWCTDPVAVPETRPQRRTDTAPPWTLRDAAMLSVGFVLRDMWKLTPGKGIGWYRTVVAEVESRGVTIASVDLFATRDAARYAHKLPAGVVAQPYTATIGLGRVVPRTGILAIGQSRHLGGGLLVPIDVPHDLAAAMLGVRS